MGFAYSFTTSNGRTIVGTDALRKYADGLVLGTPEHALWYLPPSQPQVSPPMNTGATMKTIRNVLAALSLVLATACDTDISTSSATDAPASSTSDTSGGYVCEDVGQACDLDAPACAPGLDCVKRPDARTGVCAQACETGADCDMSNGPAGCIGGMCRDPDGLPIGLCKGVPACAGDPCEGQCANGLSCLAGSCALACETAKDCGDGQVCLAGVCFAGGDLVDPCDPSLFL